MAQRKRVDLTQDQKRKIIAAVDGPPKQSFTAVAKLFSIDRSTVSKLYAKREKVEAPQAWLNSGRKRQRGSAHTDVDEALFRWFRAGLASNVPLTGDVLRGKAEKLAKDLGLEEFTATSGWLDRWKTRHNIVFKRAHGEKRDADTSSAGLWIKETLPQIMARYSPADIYNADETGLYYRALPTGSHVFKTDQLSGGKVSKDRITVMVCANMAGEKRPLLVIGKSKQPRCFRGMGRLPCQYTNSSSAWMTSPLFETWLREWEKELKQAKRKIALIVDNCPAHPDIQLPHIELIFLPPNVTSLIQPCDQGIIRSLKSHYRKAIVNKILAVMEAAEDELTADMLAKKLDLLTAIIALSGAWRAVTEQTVKNCFRKASFAVDGADSDNELEESQPIELPSTLTEAEFEDFLLLDDNIDCTEQLDDEQIIDDIRQAKEDATSADSVAEEDDADEIIPTVSATTALASLQSLKHFLAQNDTCGLIGDSTQVIFEDIFASINKTDNKHSV